MTFTDVETIKGDKKSVEQIINHFLDLLSLWDIQEYTEMVLGLGRKVWMSQGEAKSPM